MISNKIIKYQTRNTKMVQYIIEVNGLIHNWRKNTDSKRVHPYKNQHGDSKYF